MHENVRFGLSGNKCVDRIMAADKVFGDIPLCLAETESAFSSDVKGVVWKIRECLMSLDEEESQEA